MKEHMQLLRLCYQNKKGEIGVTMAVEKFLATIIKGLQQPNREAYFLERYSYWTIQKSIVQT